MSRAPHQAHDDHGHSVAAWVTVMTLIVASLVGAFAFVIASVAVFWAAVGLVVLGVVAGKALQIMGFGVAASRAAADERASV